MQDQKRSETDKSWLGRASRADLIERLARLEAQLASREQQRNEVQERSLQDLQIHQAELEMQNTEMQATQLRLEASRARYYDLYHATPTGYLTLNQAGKICEVNEAAAGLLGRTYRHLKTTFLVDCLAVDSRASFSRMLAAILSDGVERTLEVFARTDSTSKLSSLQLRAKSFANVRFGEQDTAMQGCVHVSLADVAQRQNFDQQIMFLLSLSDTLFENLDPKVVAGKIAQLAVPFLAEAASFYAVQQQSAVAVALRAPFVQAQRDDFECWTRHLQNSTLVQQAVLQRKLVLVDCSDATARNALLGDCAQFQQVRKQVRTVAALPVVSRQQTVGILLLFQHHKATRRYYAPEFFADFSRRMGLAVDNASLLQRSQQESLARQNLLAIVSHDLRNPLSVILLKSERMAQLVGKEAQLSDAGRKQQQSVKLMLQCAQHMNALIEDLLDATSMESGTFNVVSRPESLLAIFDEMAEVAQGKLLRKNIVLCVELDRDVEVLCDRQRILQVLGNLLGNAEKFTAAEGSVRVFAVRQADNVCIGVADTGRGMPQEACNLIFDRYWQSQDTAHLGCGLGLHICKGIVEAGGGRIWAQSVEGMGSTFFFTLPCAG